MKKIIVGDDNVSKVHIGNNDSLVLIGGPCAIESEEHSLFMADSIRQICDKYSVQFIFKSCYDKDCRSSVNSFHGLGLDAGLKILLKVKKDLKIPVTSDVSNSEWVEETAEVVDMIQIPAYLCRQTHLLVAAGNTGKPINIKKGQFMSPWNMRNSIMKIIKQTGNDQIMQTERGTFFGYNMLVNDYRGLQIMRDFGYPVCYDATHSIQMPTGHGTVSSGQKEFIPALVRAAVACGVDALFMEIHDDPKNALSDPATQVNLNVVEQIIAQATELFKVNKELTRKWGNGNVS